MARVRAVASRGLLLRYEICPLPPYDASPLRVASATPSGDAIAHEIALALGRRAEIVRVARDAVATSIERLAHGDPETGDALDAMLRSVPALDDPKALALQPPVVRYVSLLCREAIANRASDIHLDAKADGLWVRYRIDGQLVDAPAGGGISAEAVLSRLKLLAELDIADRRRPQDGRMLVRVGDRTVDLRVSTAPSLHGESMVLRVLDAGRSAVALAELGMPPGVLAAFQAAIARRAGLVLVTGPTGSGKTTTLYAALSTRATGTEKVVTIEDPVEIELAGVTQVPVHRETGVTFASALRALLRHDPDVLMVGELRDEETAAVAVQAAMTGHTVFATVHTTDALGALARLIDLGVPRFLIAETLAAVVAQRLVRRCCAACGGVSREQPADRATPACDDCRGEGLRGRVGVFEIVVVSEALRAAILAGAPRVELEQCARRDGWVPLADAGTSLVNAGITTSAEMHRVLLAA
jgi:type II secretory ATPase GspE/PulE/Tfp pilus assembly ATPase PilB-like protein